jgi:type IV pilus assembly protein PilC
MEFDGLKIGSTPKKEEVDSKKQTSQPKEVDASEYIVDGAEVGEDVLQGLKNNKQQVNEKVIYGVSDQSNGIIARINNFLIDNSKVSVKEKAHFFHMLAVMVDAGIPIIKGVSSLAHKTSNLRFKRVLDTIAHSCEGGSKLSNAMMRFEDVFDEAEVGIVKSGEATGRLDVMLFKLSEQLEKIDDIQSKLWLASFYPIAVFVVLLVVAVVMLVGVVPTLLDLLLQGGVEDLPLATKVLIALQEIVTQKWWMIIIGGLSFYAVFSMYKNSMYGAVRWDYFKLKMPVIGKLLRKFYVFRFSSMLGILTESGLPVISALKIIGNSIPNRIYKLKIQEVINEVKVGGKISDSLKDSEFLFASEVVQIIGVGEASASVDKVCDKISVQYSKEMDDSLSKVMTLFKIGMILLVGMFVALLALAIMAPLFNLGNSLAA